MEQSIYKREILKISKFDKIPLYIIIVVFVFLLAVLQDYIFSSIQQTGFYISESLLYNTFWIFFIPFTFIINKLIKIINPKNKLGKLPLNLGIGLIISVLHILFFTSIFILVSNLVFTPAHSFSNIIKAAFSNQFYIALLWYVIFPAIYISIYKKPHLTNFYQEKIKLKIGSKIITIPTSSILLISTDKPYSIIYTKDQKILDNKSLKEFETRLDPTIFLRVHRSTIINAKYTKELKSRSNGDYDATLENGQVIRLSRHYRGNWQQLLQ
ncbi:LytR/AlgR family response regulator transcription factor [Formosa maritima]|uniref:LytTR family transcriptional regulator n=1 Tax=Formosa maritima TaxID=2592046 RepID=A0A5D0GBB5_9FLAO|nr:LytTR family DNA-binding domain-containing protein [Formosa maritima]TYA56323.1 LytTR family transcriptional regulator [Formosa maritima]